MLRVVGSIQVYVRVGGREPSHLNLDIHASHASRNLYHVILTRDPVGRRKPFF